MKDIPSFTTLSDVDLRAAVAQSVAAERAATARLIALLAEYDRRRLYLADGFTSLFQFCVAGLHLSESAAFTRIQAARASRKWPVVLQALIDGSVTLTTVGLLAPHFTDENCVDLITEARHQRKSSVERIVARLAPKPDAPSLVRRLPCRALADHGAMSAATLRQPTIRSGAPPASSESQLPMTAAAPVPAPRSVPDPRSVPAPAPASARTTLAPLSPERYKLQVTIGAAARERLAQIQALMRHRVPNGDPAAIVEYALEALHAELLKQKAAQVARPRVGRSAREAKGRYIPASVKRVVWRRDQGRCAFVAPDGRRCGSEHGVEFHHVQPYAVGGEATTTNIEMRCRAHNGFEWHRHLEHETMSLVEQSM